MLGQGEFGMRLQMAAETGGRIFARIDDELPPSTPYGNVFAPGTMAGLTTGQADHFSVFQMQPAMGTRREHASNIGVALVAAFIADE
jgi:hypothetical protein